MKLYEALRSKPNGDSLAYRLQSQIRDRALKKLEHTKDLFPTYTDHTIRHSDGVVEILDWLLPDSVKEQLNEWEFYFLLAAAYLHDLGMVEGCPGPPSGDDWDHYLSDYESSQRAVGITDLTVIRQNAKRNYVRDNHQERSEQYIRTNATELDLRASDMAAEGQIVGRLALGHRKVDLSDRTQFGEVPFGNNQFRTYAVERMDGERVE